MSFVSISVLSWLGAFLGAWLGAFLGARLGALLGAWLGAWHGALLGAWLCVLLGAWLGAWLGADINYHILNNMSSLRRPSFISRSQHSHHKDHSQRASLNENI